MQVHSFWAGQAFLFVSTNDLPGALAGCAPRKGTVSLLHTHYQCLQSKCVQLIPTWELIAFK